MTGERINCCCCLIGMERSARKHSLLVDRMDEMMSGEMIASAGVDVDQLRVLVYGEGC